MINDQIISFIRFLCVHALFFLHYHVLNELNNSIIADVVYFSSSNSFYTSCIVEISQYPCILYICVGVVQEHPS